MSILIKGMKMPNTGLYFVSVDNTGGKDRTVMTVERMLGNRDVRQIIGSFELVPVPPHGDLIDRDEMKGSIRMQTAFLRLIGGEFAEIAETLEEGFLQEIDNAPTIIPAEEGE